MTLSGLHRKSEQKRKCILRVVIILLFTGLVTARAGSSQSLEYQMPPQEIADIIDAAPTPHVSVSPNNDWILIMSRPNLPSIKEVSQPELRLAGLRINPRTNGRSRASYYTDLTLKRISNSREQKITGLPEDAHIRRVTWSPDGKKIAFTVTGENGIELWVAEVKSAEARQIPEIILNDSYAYPYRWLSDSRTLICNTLLSDRGAPPEAPTVPSGPVVQENIGKVAPAVTYADLLKNVHDEALLEYYLKSQVIRVNLKNEITPIGPEGMIARIDPSPDGRYILVETLHRPFSYLVTVSRFPRRVEIWDRDGSVVRLVTDQPLAEEIPVVTGAVRTGPRKFDWRSDVEATLFWTEALDDGDPRKDADVRDQIYTMKAPFKGNPIPLFTLGLRYERIIWGNDDLAVISEWWWKTRRVRSWAFAPASQRVEPEVLFDYSWEDRYSDPGQPILRRNEAGKSVLLTGDGGTAIFLSGDGASPEGDRPFLDELNLVTKETERLWRSEAPYFERTIRLLDEKKQKILTLRESVTEVPNLFVRDLRKEEIRQLTDFPHPAPQLKDVQKELIRFKRDDGLDLTATLYLPADYTPDQGQLPLLMWAYPREYKSADAAGQVTDSPYRFIRIGWWSPMLWLIEGYAILDRTSMPVVGEGDEEPNDTFVRQLVANARAAIDECVRRGVADPERVAIGGHSYGAFMTANLLAHSDLFRAGIARTGAYNRTLTPFGFQSEDRTFWEAPNIYFEMSPFMHADKISEPILLIHGEADNNPGTFPIQSERFYNALKGHGATARLVMLPHESHSYRARESVMHMLWETDRWLNKYVKNASPREPAEVKE